MSLLLCKGTDSECFSPVMTLTDVVLSVPRPACDGSHSVIPCQRFSSGSTDSGFVCALSRLYSWLWQHGRIRGKNNQLRMMSQTDKKYLFPLRDSLLGQWCEFNFLILRGQGWNKWRVIYSPLIKTTLNFSPSPPSPPFSSLSEWFHDFCPLASQETDVNEIPAGFCFRSKTW